MSPQQLSAAIKLSLTSALSTKQTSIAEAVFVLETHKASLVQLAFRPQPEQSPIQPASSIPVNGHRG
jgi:hypothetical protein